MQVTEKSYKLGVWVKDSMQGLGTITYLKEDGEFAELKELEESDKDSLPSNDEFEKGNEENKGESL